MKNAEHKDSADWHSTKDPKTGRIYYYNAKTRATQWDKPIQLMTPEERDEKLRLKEETKKFFRDMELNIKRKAQSKEGEDIVPELKPLDRIKTSGFPGRADKLLYKGGMAPRTRLVRTISSIDDEIVNSQKFSPGAVQPNDSIIMSLDDSAKETGSVSVRSFFPLRQGKKKKSEKNVGGIGVGAVGMKQPPLIRTTSHGIKRRNSTGTLFVGTTISNQDDEATIHCVVALIRSHMLDAAKESYEGLSSEFDSFRDLEFITPTPKASRYDYKHSFLQSIGLQKKNATDIESVPSLDVIRDFFQHIFSKAQMNSECIIITVIYLERLIKVTKGRFLIRSDNWKSVIFACMIMASKVWDDLSMWNVDFSHVLPSFNLHRVNELELAMLEALQYEVKVSAGEYAKYYFFLRSMMARLGFHVNEVIDLAPLDLSGARKLQLSTEQYQQNSLSEQSGKFDSSMKARPVSMQLPIPGMRRNLSDGTSFPQNYQSHTTVGLEQIIHKEHMDADGMPHLVHKNS